MMAEHRCPRFAPSRDSPIWRLNLIRHRREKRDRSLQSRSQLLHGLRGGLHHLFADRRLCAVNDGIAERDQIAQLLAQAVIDALAAIQDFYQTIFGDSPAWPPIVPAITSPLWWLPPALALAVGWDAVRRVVSARANWLARRDLMARTVTIKVRYADFTTVTRSHTAPPTRDPDAIISRAVRLLDRTEAGRLPVRLLGVSVHNFRGDEDVKNATARLPFEDGA